MTYELQHSDIPQPKLLDADPVSAAPWPLPPVKRWEPVSGFDLDAMCEEALDRLGSQLRSEASWQHTAIAMAFGFSHVRLGVRPTSYSVTMGEPIQAAGHISD